MTEKTIQDNETNLNKDTNNDVAGNTEQNNVSIDDKQITISATELDRLQKLAKASEDRKKGIESLKDDINNLKEANQKQIEANKLVALVNSLNLKTDEITHLRSMSGTQDITKLFDTEMGNILLKSIRGDKQEPQKPEEKKPDVTNTFIQPETNIDKSELAYDSAEEIAAKLEAGTIKPEDLGQYEKNKIKDFIKAKIEKGRDLIRFS